MTFVEPVHDLPRRVLIVGDPVLSRGLLRMVLARLGYVVSAVISGAEALAMVAHTRFALVMVAAHLPDMGGDSLTRRISHEARLAGPPILMFGDAIERQAQPGPDAANAFLVKPISIARLVAALRELTMPAGNPLRLPAERSNPMADPIDLDHLNGFTDGDRQLERELGTLFVATAGQYLDRLRRAQQLGLDGVQEWRMAAHALKGASANLGAVAVAAVARRAELGSPSASILSELSAQLDLVERFLDQRRARPRAVATG